MTDLRLRKVLKSIPGTKIYRKDTYRVICLALGIRYCSYFGCDYLKILIEHHFKKHPKIDMRKRVAEILIAQSEPAKPCSDCPDWKHNHSCAR